MAMLRSPNAKLLSFSEKAEQAAVNFGISPSTTDSDDQIFGIEDTSDDDDLDCRQAVWPDTESDNEIEIIPPRDFVRSVDRKKSGSMEKVLWSAQFSKVAPRSLIPHLRQKVCRFATNRVGCQVLELLVPKLGVHELDLIASECIDEVAVLSSQKYGFRSMRSIFAALIQKPQLHELLSGLVREMLDEFGMMALDPFASVILADLFEHGPQQIKSDLVQVMLEYKNVSFMTLCFQEDSCRVIAAAIRHCSLTAVVDMAGKLLARDSIIFTFRPGCVLVLRALLENSTVAPFVKEQLERHGARLQRCRHGRNLANDISIVG